MAGGIKVTIGANAGPFAKGLQSVNRRIAGWAARLPGRFARAGIAAGRRFVRGLVRTIRRGIIGAGVLGAGLIGKSISEAGRFEKYDLQFEALLGTAEKAQKRMNEIKQVDLEAPFDITSITDASRVLTVFTENAFAGTKALKMMADAASVTPNDIKDVAFWYGRAYSMIQSGRPFGEAAMRLQEMGLLTGKARNEMERFSGVNTPKAIESSMEILNSEFLKFHGAAAKLAKTWPGIMSIFTSASKQSFDEVGKEILPLAKYWLEELIAKMTELRNNGTFSTWGQNVAWAFYNIRQGVESAIPKIKEFSDKAKLYLSAFSKNVEDNGITSALSDEIVKGLEFSIEKLADALDKYLPGFIEFGVEIGAAIAEGFARGLAKTKAARVLTAALTLGGSELFRGAAAKRTERQNKRMMSKGAFEQLTPEMLKNFSPSQIQNLQSQRNAPSWLKNFNVPSGPQHVIIDHVSSAAQEELNPTPKGGM